GRVNQVTSAVPPPDLGLGNKPLPRISIFMSVFDCHVNRSPVAGKIEKIVYHPGKFFNADIDKASVDNERNCVVIATASTRIAVMQIAGLVARRIVCFVRTGQSVGAGERLGMIRFGSRLDVYLPEGTPPLVATGQTSIGGGTVLADLSGGGRGLKFRSGKIVNEVGRKPFQRCGAGRNTPLYSAHGLSAFRPCPAAVPASLQGDSGPHSAAQSDHLARA